MECESHDAVEVVLAVRAVASLPGDDHWKPIRVFMCTFPQIMPGAGRDKFVNKERLESFAGNRVQLASIDWTLPVSDVRSVCALVA